MDIVSKVRDDAKLAVQNGFSHVADRVRYACSDVRVDRTRLAAVFAAHGFQACAAETVSAENALGRASRRGARKGFLVKPFARSADGRASVGVYLQRPGDTAEAGDRFPAGARVREEIVGGVTRFVALPPENGTAEPACLRLAETIRDAANELFQYASAVDVTAACIKVITGPLRGLAFIQGEGGDYVVLPAEGARWAAFAADLSALLGDAFRDAAVPLVSWAGNTRAAEQAAVSVERGLDAEVAKILCECEEWDETTRTSTMEGRIAALDALLHKAALYGSILTGAQRARLDNAVDGVKRRITAKLAGADGLPVLSAAPAAPAPAPAPAPAARVADAWSFDAPAPAAPAAEPEPAPAPAPKKRLDW